MRSLLIILFFVALAAQGQNLKVYKQNGIWKYDQSGPLQSYPITGGIVTDTTAIPDPPAPVLPSDDTTKIDGRNGTFVGGWTHGTGDALWYKKTLSFSNVAGNTTTFKFQGTKLELWGEKKSSHGTGTVTIKLGSTVVHTQAVSFVNATTVLPALIYTSPNLTPLTNYTVELKVTSGWNLIDFLVIWNYQESTVVTDHGPDPLPPNPGEILIQPGQDINNAIKNLPRGSNVRLAAGNHTIGKLAVPDGVNFRGSGKTNTFLNPTSGIWPSNNDDAMINIRGGTGSQVISDFTIKGNNTATGGIFINRNNVSVENVKVENCKFFGLWSSNNTGFKTYELDLSNNSWSSVGWCSGEIVLGGLMNNFDIELGLVQTTSSTKGYGLKILWNSDTDNSNVLQSGKIHGGRFDLMHYSLWNNGQSKNISIEFHNVDVTGTVDIFDMVFENQVSFSLQRNNVGTINVFNSVFKLEGDTYVLEHIGNNFNLYNCQIYETSMILANFKQNMKCKNARVDNITFTQPSGSAMYGALIYVGESGVENVRVMNSTIDQLPGMALVKYRGVTGGVTIDGSNTIY